MKVFSINGSIYNNSVLTDSVEELGKYITELAKRAPEKTIFVIRVLDIPKPLFEEREPFEGFKLKGEVDGRED